MSTLGAKVAGLRAFLLMWSGQVVSLVGSGLTAFAIGVWVYNETGNVTLYTLIATFAALPAVFLSPVAGVLVDRHDRKWMLILSDSGAAVSSVVLLLLFHFGGLELWHIYVLVSLNAAFNTLQFPAFGASITMLVPKEHFGRASGMMQFGHAGARVLAPLIAGFLMVVTTVAGIIAIDLATFVVAIVMLTFVHIPRPEVAEEERGGRPSFWRQVMFGWEYIRERRGLVTLLTLFAFLNLVVPMAMVLVTPMVLSFTDAADLGLVLAISSAGMMVGSVVMTAWGGPRRRMLGILGLAPLAPVGLVVAGLRPSVSLIAAGMFLLFLTLPLINGCSQAIWQSKVEPAVQGRVFATRRMVAQVTGPVAFFLAGPLSEQVFVPLLEPGGTLAGTAVGALLGVGDGRGIGLLFLALAVLFLLVIAAAWTYPRLRDLEDRLPDAVPSRPPEPGPAAAPGEPAETVPPTAEASAETAPGDA